MPETYTVVEMMPLGSLPTMPQRTQFPQAVWLHAAVDGEDGATTVVCPYLLVSDKDLIKRELPFVGNTGPIVHRTPKCPVCEAEIRATG